MSLKKFFSLLSKIVLFLLCAAALERFCYYQTAGFRVAKISSDFVFDVPKDITPSEEVLNILDQQFYFLGSGVQCYAFLSEDQTTVLKVFKHHHMWPRTEWLKKMPLPHRLDLARQKTIDHREKRLNSILSSTALAFDEYKEETGLIYVHLNKTKNSYPKLKIFDKLGIAHEIDLDRTEFVLQKKADVVTSKINALMQKNDIEGAKRCIDSLLDLIQIRLRKGLNNTDPIIQRNFGFIDEKAVEIDIGSFQKNSRLASLQERKKEFYYETLGFRDWVESHHPLLQEYLVTKINILIEHD